MIGFFLLMKQFYATHSWNIDYCTISKYPAASVMCDHIAEPTISAGLCLTCDTAQIFRQTRKTFLILGSKKPHFWPENFVIHIIHKSFRQTQL
jgi:hypothetical protein